MATGSDPHISFAEVCCGTGRWGDYSSAVLDSDTGDIWMATEHIPPPGSQDSADNWGTEVFVK